MPIYEYRCRGCGRISEFFENTANRRRKSCLYCGSKALERLISTFAPGVKSGSSKRCQGCTDHICPRVPE